MTKDNFQQSVVEKSHEKPVLVDFWAPWCAPCRTLGPVIEALAEEQKDRWELVKVNTEEAQDIAESYGIKSIPNVKLFHRGEVIGEFTGALGRVAIERWLNENLPDDRNEELTLLLQNLEQGASGAIANLENFVEANEDIADARLALAMVLVWTDPVKANDLVSSIRLGQPQYDSAEDIRTMAELLNFKANGNPISTTLAEAGEALREAQMEKGIQLIIDAVTANKTYQKDLPRRAAIALFRILGPDHALSKSYRWRFDMALY
ncbi:MAG: thioredoxin [Saprospiraceae bacterium]|nr:MAG: thioredoxin [Saprospiraceae bacterium]